MSAQIRPEEQEYSDKSIIQDQTFDIAALVKPGPLTLPPIETERKRLFEKIYQIKIDECQSESSKGESAEQSLDNIREHNEDDDSLKRISSKSTQIYPKTFEGTGTQLDQLQEIKKELVPLDLHNKIESLEMRCNNCQYLIETQVKTSWKFVDILLKSLLLIFTLVFTPLIFILVIVISACLASDICKNVSRTFQTLKQRIFSWVTLHECPKCNILVARSINF
ncbi:UNKNOWN [Stylonychia lemnae]|uniref:LITAF domain-containing protein n=1 Tax=Stylonychia lemnae TaxID=5949 RepID=A0A078AMY2_STYLE|nr:UNKNOWN [Stylonychia lemnae]|eukprot:CDW83286.1 UNKNOWN [Stylonychia lemnae]